jgi:hypothetical protein
MARRLLPLALALLGACRSAPAPTFQRLQIRSDKLTYSTGPPPHSGYTFCGAVPLKDAPRAGERSLPRKLVGADGSAEFLPKFTRVRVVDGVFYFRGVVEERAYYDATGFLKHDPHVRIEFEDPGSGTWSAQGTMDHLHAGQAFHSDLERAFEK